MRHITFHTEKYFEIRDALKERLGKIFGQRLVLNKSKYGLVIKGDKKIIEINHITLNAHFNIIFHFDDYDLDYTYLNSGGSFDFKVLFNYLKEEVV